ETLDLSRGLEILSSFRIPHLELQKWQDSIKDAIKTDSLSKNTQLKALVRLEEILKNLVAQIEKASLQKALESKEAIEPQKQESKTAKKIKGYKNASMLPIDAATTLIGKAGMQEALNYAEAEFKENGYNYSVIVFGITKYDKVKEVFGQEAAKKILMTLGRLLKQYSNSSDLIAYWGDEEFLACLLEREKKEAIKFICDLDLIVQKSVFMYQQTRIEIALSAQATHRVSESSLESMLKVSLDEFVKNKDTQGIICHKNLQ
ncbi:MAG: diguanylate cyclase, partial [Helicobacter sp.]|nr:diguanylate cyclase [Helicobacter sp.]